MRLAVPVLVMERVSLSFWRIAPRAAAAVGMLAWGPELPWSHEPRAPTKRPKTLVTQPGKLGMVDADEETEGQAHRTYSF
jgi:hypothetical protein